MPSQTKWRNVGWKTSTFFIQRLQTFFIFVTFLRYLTFFFYFFFWNVFLHLWFWRALYSSHWLTLWEECIHALILYTVSRKSRTLHSCPIFNIQFIIQNAIGSRTVVRQVVGEPWYAVISSWHGKFRMEDGKTEECLIRSSFSWRMHRTQYRRTHEAKAPCAVIDELLLCK